MEPSFRRTLTLEKIDRSISECLSLEQIASTEQFLSLYYKQFSFNLQYLKREWDLDNQIIKRKKQLDQLAETDDELNVSAYTRKSLKRLEDHIKTLSRSKFEAEWEEIQVQLQGIDLAHTNIYGIIHEKFSYLHHLFQSGNRNQLQEH